MARKIIVRDRIYTWSFKQMRDSTCYSSLSIISQHNIEKYILKFRTKDTLTCGNPLNEGLPVKKNGLPLLVNLNRPYYIGEILQFILDHRLESGKEVYKFNGNQILLDMGYKDIDGYFIEE